MRAHPHRGAEISLKTASCRFFPLFGSFIYRLTSDAQSVTFATLAVLSYFESQGCIYLELRTTPRSIPTLSAYLSAVRAGFDAFRPQRGMLAKLLLSVDRRHSAEMAERVVELALGNRDLVVGIDLCGDPTRGDAALFVPAFAKASEAGLRITVHLGEVGRSCSEVFWLSALMWPAAGVAARESGGGFEIGAGSARARDVLV